MEKIDKKRLCLSSATIEGENTEVAGHKKGSEVRAQKHLNTNIQCHPASYTSAAICACARVCQLHTWVCETHPVPAESYNLNKVPVRNLAPVLRRRNKLLSMFTETAQ